MLHAAGGIIVALTVKYSDNIAKTARRTTPLPRGSHVATQPRSHGLAPHLTRCSRAARQFATSIAILVSCVGTYLLFGAQLSPQFSLGLVLVLVATIAYSWAPGKEARAATQAQAAERYALLPSGESDSGDEVSPR